MKASASSSMRGKMVRPALEDLADLVDRQACRRQRGRPALPRQQLGKVGQPFGLLAIGAEELYHRRRGVGRRLGDLDQFLVARQFAGKQRVGEHFLQRRDRAARLAMQFVRLDLVDGGELEDELYGQRPLVALDEVEVGRARCRALRPSPSGSGPWRCGCGGCAARRRFFVRPWLATYPRRPVRLPPSRLIYSILQTPAASPPLSAFTILTNLQPPFVKGNTGLPLFSRHSVDFPRLFRNAM